MACILQYTGQWRVYSSIPDYGVYTPVYRTIAYILQYTGLWRVYFSIQDNGVYTPVYRTMACILQYTGLWRVYSRIPDNGVHAPVYRTMACKLQYTGLLRCVCIHIIQDYCVYILQYTGLLRIYSSIPDYGVYTPLLAVSASYYRLHLTLSTRVLDYRLRTIHFTQ